MNTFARWASPVAVGTAVLTAAGAVGFALRGPISTFDVLLAVTAVIFVPTALVGSAIIRTNSRNVVGWIFLIAGAAQPLSVLLQIIADAAYVHHDRSVSAPAAF